MAANVGKAMQNWLNVVTNNYDHLTRLQTPIQHLHNRGAIRCDTVLAPELARRQNIWKGEVEGVDLNGQPKAKCCHGWSHPSGKDDKDVRFATGLGIPSVVSAETAVRVQSTGDVKKEIL